MHSQPHLDAGPAMKLHQMRYLVAVAGCGSVRAASRALGITQSAITQALRELEEGHRLALFERQSSGIVLTPAGRTLLRHAQLITGQMAQAEDEMARLRDTCAVARLSVGVTPWVWARACCPMCCAPSAPNCPRCGWSCSRACRPWPIRACAKARWTC
ncbi:LysR family transcriptional regulator [Delftia lacustris]